MQNKRISLLILFILLLLVIFPAHYMQSVTDAVALFTASVLPSMLPFFFFTKLLTSVGGADGLSKSIGKPLGKLYGCSPVCGYVFAMSLLSGYPVGAKVTYDLYQAKLIDTDTAGAMSAFCSTSGSMFVLGSIGSAVLHNAKMGWIILISHYLGATLNGVVWNFRRRACPAAVPRPATSRTADNVLSEAMHASVISLALCGGYIVVCNLCCDMLADVIGMISGKNIAANPSAATAIIFGLIEMTRGCITLSQCALPAAAVTCLCTFFISFGGLSVLLQSTCFLSKCKIKSGSLVLKKASQAAISAVISLCLALIFL